MRKPAIALLLAGAVFTVFTVPFAGIDLFIDAVGFLLMFNALRALRLLEPGFGPGAFLCLVLVPVAALQLFLGGVAGAALWLLRGLAAGVLCLLMARGFGCMLEKEYGPRPALAARVLLCLAAAAALGQGVWLFVMRA